MTKWKPPQKAKRDANEPDVFAALEAHGLTVCPTDKPLDSVVAYAGVNYLVEVGAPHESSNQILRFMAGAG